jgi:hypothetical protein
MESSVNFNNALAGDLYDWGLVGAKESVASEKSRYLFQKQRMQILTLNTSSPSTQPVRPAI